MPLIVRREKVTPVRYAIVIENAGSNYSAYVPDFPGCIAAGETVAEVEQLIREAIEFCTSSSSMARITRSPTRSGARNSISSIRRGSIARR